MPEIPPEIQNFIKTIPPADRAGFYDWLKAQKSPGQEAEPAALADAGPAPAAGGLGVERKGDSFTVRPKPGPQTRAQVAPPEASRESVFSKLRTLYQQNAGYDDLQKAERELAGVLAPAGQAQIEEITSSAAEREETRRIPHLAEQLYLVGHGLWLDQNRVTQRRELLQQLFPKGDFVMREAAANYWRALTEYRRDRDYLDRDPRSLEGWRETWTTFKAAIDYEAGVTEDEFNRLKDTRDELERKQKDFESRLMAEAMPEDRELRRLFTDMEAAGVVAREARETVFKKRGDYFDDLAEKAKIKKATRDGSSYQIEYEEKPAAADLPPTVRADAGPAPVAGGLGAEPAPRLKRSRIFYENGISYQDTLDDGKTLKTRMEEALAEVTSDISSIEVHPDDFDEYARLWLFPRGAIIGNFSSTPGRLCNSTIDSVHDRIALPNAIVITGYVITEDRDKTDTRTDAGFRVHLNPEGTDRPNIDVEVEGRIPDEMQDKDFKGEMEDYLRNLETYISGDMSAGVPGWNMTGFHVEQGRLYFDFSRKAADQLQAATQEIEALKIQLAEQERETYYQLRRANAYTQASDAWVNHALKMAAEVKLLQSLLAQSRAQGPERSAAQEPRRQTQTPFEVLGVPETASQEEIIRAYRELQRAHHPDAVGAILEQAGIDLSSVLSLN